MKLPEIILPNLSQYDTRAKNLMVKRGIMLPSENINDVFDRVIGTLISVDTKLNNHQMDLGFAQEFIEFIEDKTIVLGSPILTNVGRDNINTTAACTVLPLPVQKGILMLEEFKISSQQLFEDAVGIGYDLSELEDPVGSLKQINTFLKELNTSLTARQKRPVASMATLRVDHPKIIEFIQAKRQEDFQQWCLNCSVFVTEDVFAKAKQNESIDLIDRNGHVAKAIPASMILNAIAESAHYCGEPGILFRDRFEADNPTPDLKYLSTAPCAEVAMAAHEVCQFSYINLTDLITTYNGKPAIDFDKLQKSARVLTRLLDDATQITIENDYLGREQIAAKRRIGVGITGFAALLMNLAIPYDSPEASTLAAQISEVIDFATKRASVDLAKSRGAFPLFFQSRFTDPAWVQRKMVRTTKIIDKEKWQELFDDISHFGIRHATTTAFPPTGFSSRIVDTTTSFEPALQLTYPTKEQDTNVSYSQVYEFVEKALLTTLGPEFNYVLSLIAQNGSCIPDELLDQISRVFAVARQISHQAHMNIQEAFLRFADESGAKTINLPQATSIEEVRSIIESAYRLGLKGLTVFRDKSLEERNLSL